MRSMMTAAVAMTLAACAAAPPVFEGEPYGEPLTLSEVTDVSAILAAPGDYVGRRVLIEGEVTAVCDGMGCWMDVKADGDGEILVRVEHNVIVFPMSAKGKTALVEGTVQEVQLTAEQAFAAAAHRAEERGEAFDSTAVFEPTPAYHVQGIGALIR